MRGISGAAFALVPEAKRLQWTAQSFASSLSDPIFATAHCDIALKVGTDAT
jgi:hypothetical protein